MILKLILKSLNYTGIAECFTIMNCSIGFRKIQRYRGQEDPVVWAHNKG